MAPKRRDSERENHSKIRGSCPGYMLHPPVLAGMLRPAELQQNVWLKERTLCLGRTGVGYVSLAEEPSGCLYK